MEVFNVLRHSPVFHPFHTLLLRFSSGHPLQTGSVPFLTVRCKLFDVLNSCIKICFQLGNALLQV